jgi:hypothetical protein
VGKEYQKLIQKKTLSVCFGIKNKGKIMRFEDIIQSIRVGKKVRRKGWGAEDFCLKIEGSRLTCNPLGVFNSFHITLTLNDLDSDDWEVIEKKTRPYKVGDVVEDKSGQTVRIICVDRSFEHAQDYPVIGLIADAKGFERLGAYSATGQSFLRSGGSDLTPVYEEIK